MNYLVNNSNKCADAFAVFAGSAFCSLKCIEDKTVQHVSPHTAKAEFKVGEFSSLPCVWVSGLKQNM